ncbi:MAG TPA: alpha/beta fold hydrolase [Stellaceae bacterium]|jgi:pimeloyl-ACP methyl ester carboxylesterase|nr:alpha/beta fold hydrolase [Stellaceae bacterium]
MTFPLAATEYGEGPPLAILHGLFGSGRNWMSIAQRLGVHNRVITLDARNHGASPWAETMNYREMADDVRETLLARGYRRFALLGHSMGGKTAMIAALVHGGEIERLIVVDIAPVPYQPHHLGLVRAMRGLDLSAVKRRADADALMAPHVPDPAERGFLLQNLLFDAGEVRWRLNLAAIEAQMAILGEFPAASDSASYPGPTLFLAGERSDYLLPEYEPAIGRRFPNARIARVANAGHWLHAEQPRAFLGLVEPFLAAAD